MIDTATTRNTVRADSLRIDATDGIVRIVEAERAGRVITVRSSGEGARLEVTGRGACVLISVTGSAAVDVEVPRAMPVRIDAAGTAFVEVGDLSDTLEVFVAGSAIVQAGSVQTLNAMVAEGGALGVTHVVSAGAFHLAGRSQTRIGEAFGASLSLAARDHAQLHVDGPPGQVALTASDQAQIWLPPSAQPAHVSRSGQAQVTRMRQLAEAY